ncbi:MAG: HD domain-containing protein [Hydrogenibacillus sp.]|nr:HD domain-containing protein [Hydrogenibacillus sp.]
MRMAVDNALVGRVLSAPVVLQDGGRLYDAGTRLHERDIEFLRAFGITAVDVTDEPGGPKRNDRSTVPRPKDGHPSGGAADRPRERPKAAASEKAAYSALMESGLRRIALGASPPLGEWRAMIKAWLAEDADPLFWVGLIRHEPRPEIHPHRYLADHAVRVGRLSLHIARLLGMSEAEQTQAALAGLLADAGMWRLEGRLLHHPGLYSAEERRAMQRHAELGYERLKGRMGISAEAAFSALLHHERMDGSGYPLALHGERIPRLVRIVSVADALTAGACARPHRPAKSWWAIVSEVLGSQAFAAEVREALLATLRRLPAGARVRLVDGRVATIQESSAEQPLLWTLVVGEKTLPMSALKDVVAVEV